MGFGVVHYETYRGDGFVHRILFLRATICGFFGSALPRFQKVDQGVTPFHCRCLFGFTAVLGGGHRGSS